MKFLVTWQMYEGKLHDTLSFFSQMSDDEEAAMRGDKVKLLGRWHDLVGGGGVAIMESDDAAAVSAYSLAWNRFMDIQISVVVDDVEAKAIGKQMGSGGA